jgi:hypothetical protein
MGLLAVGTALYYSQIGRRSHAKAGTGDAGAERREGVVTDITTVSDAAFRDGRWYIADQNADLIFVADTAGTILARFGGRGKGPGELLGPRSVAVTRDAIFVAEVGRFTISVFDRDGGFLRYLTPSEGCRPAYVLDLAATDLHVFVLRRCVDRRGGVEFLVERVSDDSTVTRLPIELARLDASPKGVVFHIRAIGAADDLLVVMNGNTGCLRTYNSAGTPRGAPVCLTQLARLATPEAERRRLASQWGGRLQVPDSMPRANNVAVFPGVFVVQAVEGLKEATWYALPADTPAGAEPLAVGRPRVYRSFLGEGWQLIATDELEGVRLETVRVRF